MTQRTPVVIAVFNVKTVSTAIADRLLIVYADVEDGYTASYHILHKKNTFAIAFCFSRQPCSAYPFYNQEVRTRGFLAVVLFPDVFYGGIISSVFAGKGRTVGHF